ncbi:MAG: N-6 DNA methylase [Flavobacteriales bacterium]|nr:N-6 DNA methylase [Flavobacteriales bacterium]
MTISEYITAINKRFSQGNATEHTFRGDLQQLLETLEPTISATNEPKRIACGAPDYVLMKKDIPVGFIEAKNIEDSDLEGKKKTGNKSQFDRYKASLPNLIFTDYVDFHFYLDGELQTSIKLGAVDGSNIIPIPENFERFKHLYHDFCMNVSQTIRSSQRLAELMAGKARLLADIIEKALIDDLADHLNPETELEQQLNAFKDVLIHDITPKQFADVYAQTIAYGMFAARLHDPTIKTFSRKEAAELIPKSNPFLRRLFQSIVGYDLDTRIRWVIDSLVEVFLACNVAELLKDYGRSTQMSDPIIHFYETFLAEYDPKLRKQRGVWYTPAPVVNFIVRAVDEVLKTEFGLKEGLADTSKIKVKRQHTTKATADRRSKLQTVETEEEVHRVQILDPATGTGTFLAEVIKHVHKKFKGQEGIWSSYVEKDLIPRLNGFELLMASYAMAHLQLDLLLTETGFVPTKEQRLRIFLTNSLEEYHKDTGTLFANWLSAEANEANHIKRDTPVMCVIGNPPYSGESWNKGKWISGLMEDYKKEPGGHTKLKERNPKAINSDEYKFIRYAQHYIERNGSGVIAFINPHTYLDAPVFRGLRWNLLKTFETIYTLDLHGNSTKKEKSPDGSLDINVFDIKQGVSINIFVKTGVKKTDDLGKVYHFDLFGQRKSKYDFLNRNSLSDVNFSELKPSAPDYKFIPTDIRGENSYSDGIGISELFSVKTSGIKTHDDKNLVAIERNIIETNILNMGVVYNDEKVMKYNYRPFDRAFVYYDPLLLGRAREKTIYHLKENNIGLMCVRQSQSSNMNFFDGVFITDCFADTNMFRRGGPLSFPIYSYPTINEQNEIDDSVNRIPNLNSKIIQQISTVLGLTFTNEKETNKNTFAPIDILDYIYAVLHSPAYRETYKEFLKIDFPRVPYPSGAAKFWELVKLGGQIREIHLLESETAENYITSYPKTGTNEVTRKLTKTDIGFELTDEAKQTGRVWINNEQYFDGVPLIAWEFYIGGYQPAQKWLKDRKGRVLTMEDIFHYQKIIVALTETDRLMKEIDKIGVVENETSQNG